MKSSVRDHAVRLVTGTPVERMARMAWRGIYRRIPDQWLSNAERKGRDYDRMTIEIARRTLTRNSNSVDAGAHLGELLAEFIALAPEGKHIAVEPLPRFAGWLASRFTQVRVENVALGADQGRATFVMTQDAAKSHITDSHEDPVATDTCIIVPVVTLDSLAADRRIDFIKIDVEGAERDVVLGARDTLARDSPVVVFECASRNLEAVMDAFHEIPGRTYRIDLLRDYLSGGVPQDKSDVVSRAQRDGEYYFVASAPLPEIPRRSISDTLA